MPFPALSKAYCSYINVATTNNTSTANIEKNYWWMLKAALRNELGSTTAGTRHANSVWTCIGSSDGVTAALDGVDRWGATFDPTKLISNNGGSHSWIILENITLGVQILLDLNGTGATATAGGRIALTKISVPWALDATATRSPPATSVSYARGVNGDSASSIGYFITPTTTTVSVIHYASITFDDNGEFYFVAHRSGLFAAFGGAICIRAIDGQHGVSTNVYLFGETSNGFNPSINNIWPSTNNARANGGFIRNIFGAAAVSNTADGIAQTAIAGTAISSQKWGPDVITNKIYYQPVRAFNVISGLAYRGYFPDLYQTNAPGNGVSYPTVSTQTHIQFNTFIIPMLGGVPLI